MSEEEFEDLGFNFDYHENMEEMRRIEYEKREFSRSIKYFRDWHLSEDCWTTILEFLPLIDFYRFSKVCCAFAEILTFDRRSLIFKKLYIDYPNLFSRTCSSDRDSITNLLIERVSGSDMDAAVMVEELMLLLFRRGIYIEGMITHFEGWDTECFKDDMFLRILHKDCIAKGLNDFKYIPSRLLDNKEFVMRAFKVSKTSPACYRDISVRLKTDEDIILEAVQRYPPIVTIMRLILFNVETIKKICSIILKPAKKAYCNPVGMVYHSFYKDVINWIPTDLQHHFKREELLDYFIRVKATVFSNHNKLIADNELELECIQISFFKKKDVYGTISIISHWLLKQGIDYQYSDIFLTDNYPEIVVDPIEKHPKIGTGTFTINQIISDCLEDEVFYMNLLLEQALSQKHFDFFKNFLKKGKTHTLLAKDILSGSIRDKSTITEADAFISDILSDKKIVKRLLAMYPAYFSNLPEDMKKDQEIIYIALRCPSNLNVLGNTEDNYLKILDRCFREAKRYVIKQVGFPNLKKFMTRLYFNVNENEEPISLKDKVLSYSKLIIPILKYFNREYPDIKSIIKKEQWIQIIKCADTEALETMHYFHSEDFFMEDTDIRHEFITKAKNLMLMEIGDQLYFEQILKQPERWYSIYRSVDFLAKYDYLYAKLLLFQQPYLIKRLYRASSRFRGEILQQLIEAAPETLRYTKKLKY